MLGTEKMQIKVSYSCDYDSFFFIMIITFPFWTPFSPGADVSKQAVLFGDSGMHKMALGSPPSQGFSDHPLPSAPLIPHSSYSLSSEVSFDPCTPGTLAPCLWSLLAGCCCYGNSILRAFSPPLR